MEALEGEKRPLGGEMKLKKSRLRIGASVLTRERAMRALDLIPLPRLQRTEQDDIDNRAKLESMERSQVTLRREQLLAEATLRELPLRRQTQLSEIGRNGCSLDQEL